MSQEELTVEQQASEPPLIKPFDAANPIPERPHMPDAVVEWLEERLRTTQCFLEYGGGGSTRLAASLNVPHIISVESDRSFADLLQETIDSSGTRSAFKLIHADVGKTRAWGFPETFEKFRQWPNYSLGAWAYLRRAKLAPDLILIDGRFRLACFMASLLEAQPGTIIAYDDYADRQEFYGVAERFVKPEQVIDRCGIFRVPRMLPRRALARALARVACFPE